MQDREIVAYMPVASVARQRAVPPGRLDRAWRLRTWRRRVRPRHRLLLRLVRRQARATAAELILAVAVGTVVAAVAIGFLSCLTAASVPSGLRSDRAVPHQPDNLTERRGPGVKVALNR